MKAISQLAAVAENVMWPLLAVAAQYRERNIESYGESSAAKKIESEIWQLKIIWRHPGSR